MQAKKVSLDDISEMVTVGIANAATHAYSKTGVVMLRNLNIHENVLDDSDLVYITEEFAVKYKSKALKENDILIARTGYPGQACLVPKEYEGCQTFTTLIDRLKQSDEYSPEYICFFINSPYGKSYVESMKVGSSQQNFGATVLAKMPIVLPAKNIQDEFIMFWKQTDKSKFVVYNIASITKCYVYEIRKEFNL